MFFWAFSFFLLVLLFLLHLAKKCSNKTIFIGFFEHPSKASSNIMQQQVTKPWTPPKKMHIFGDNPFFDQKQLSKTLILHHPLKTAHKKISEQKKATFIGSKKGPSYWPWGGQVIDLEMARMWPSYWPYSMHTAVKLKTGPKFGVL